MNIRTHTKEQMEGQYACFTRQRQSTDICWTWREVEDGIGIMNYQEVAIQVADWVRLGNCSIEDYNNKEVKTPDGKTWYVLVVQVVDKTGEMDESNPMGSMSVLLFGIMCSGYTYVFETAELRDAVAKAVQTKTPLPKRTILPRAEMDAEHLKDFEKRAGIVVAKEETPEEKAVRLQAEVEVLTMKPEKKAKELSPKELRKQEEKRQLAEANALLKAEKKRKEDYAKACGIFKTPEQIKKERDARFKVQCAAMKGSGGRK